MEAIVGRDAELETIERWLEAPGGRALVIEGEAGIGKTTLWRAAVARADELGMRSFVSVPTESEARLSYAGLGDVLGPIVTEVGTELPPP